MALAEHSMRTVVDRHAIVSPADLTAAASKIDGVAGAQGRR
jgi:hypothetical protein